MPKKISGHRFLLVSSKAADIMVKTELRTMLQANPDAIDFFSQLEHSDYIQGLLAHGNNVVICRLNYNDHGVTHSRISACNALKILQLLNAADIRPNIVTEGTGNFHDAELIVLGAAYLHDIGNAIHREQHWQLGLPLVDNFLDTSLKKYYSPRKLSKIKASIFECMYAHDEHVQSLSIEAGCVKVGDGADMANGRARVPFSRGKVDIHSVSALSITKVEISKGTERPVKIEVEMTCSSGVFQIQNILGEKIKTSSIKEWVEIVGLVIGRDEHRFTRIEL